MKDNRLYTILDLIEEISKVDKMIEIHKTTASNLMLSQYTSQKLKLSSLLFKELISNSDNRSEVMHLIKLFIEKFYSSDLKNTHYSANDSFKQIEDVVTQYYH